MKATCWMGKQKVEVVDVPDPKILNQRDAIVRVSSTAICGSDLHLYNGFMPTMKKGDVLGHEFMGEVMELGSEVKNLKVGDRVVVPFTIACGDCWQCQHEMWSLCENSNPNAALAETMITAGAAWGWVDQAFTTSNAVNTFVPVNQDGDGESQGATGYQAGGGIEVKFGARLSVVGEYLFTSLDNRDESTIRTQGPAPATNPFILVNASGSELRRTDRFDFQSARVGLNLRF